ncbi:MAG: YceI family protein [Streptosporangiales bacterium]|nr:YceI family protein [Streptosporangiales bacterium]
MGIGERTGAGRIIRPKWLIAALIAVVVLVVCGPFVYTRFIATDAPGALSAGPATGDPKGAAGSASADGTWRAGPGSQAGYRVQEVLFGQDTTAVGRTNAVTGSLAIAGRNVSSGSFTVDMTTLKSDRSQRDQQFQGRIMNTASFPRATFTLTKPIVLETPPAAGARATATATGDLLLRGATKSVTFEVTVVRDAADQARVSGSIPVTFADWRIPNPSIGPIETEDHGTVEFLLTLRR